MNVIVIGKSGSMGAWAENVVRAFKRDGHNVFEFSINGNNRVQRLKYKLYKSKHKQYEKYITARFDKYLKTHHVDICLCLCAFTISPTLFECLRARHPGCLNIAWVGEKFGESARYAASFFDQIYYTDTRFILDHRELGFDSKVIYMPHAVDIDTFKQSSEPKISRMLFVANRTALREEIVSRVDRTINIYGRGWKRYRHHSRHKISPRRFALKKLPAMYSSCLAVLNIKNENHMVNGLNQRSFEPYGCKTPVVHDAVSDVARCFEPGKEILVYRDTDELNAIYERLLKDQAYREKIGKAGHERVKASHTYQHRIKSFVKARG